uniref:Uncharacterized protein n=1 Tax=Peronospora matthiolae TaxID=2874970 RepID=A0AAV1VMF2_9STRA
MSAKQPESGNTGDAREGDVEMGEVVGGERMRPPQSPPIPSIQPGDSSEPSGPEAATLVDRGGETDGRASEPVEAEVEETKEDDRMSDASSTGPGRPRFWLRQYGDCIRVILAIGLIS